MAGPKAVTKISVKDGTVAEVIPLGDESKYIAGIEIQGDTLWVSLEEKARLQLRKM